MLRTNPHSRVKSIIIPGSLLLGAGGIAGFAILRQNWFYLVALFGLLLLILWPVQMALGSYVLLVPFDAVSTVGQNTSGISLIFAIGILAAAILIGLGVAFRRFDLPVRSSLWWFLFVVWAAASTLWAYDQETAIRRLPTVFSLYLFYLVATSFRISEREFSGAIVLTVLGGCAAALISAYEFYHGIYYGGEGGTRASLVVGGHSADPNIFAAGLLLPFSLAVCEFLGSATLVRKTFMLLAGGIISLTLFLTMSRGSMLALGVMLIVYLRKLRMKWRLLVPAILIAGGLLVVPNLLFQRVWQSQLTGGAGRIYIWQTGLAALKDFALAGAGLDNFPVVYDHYMSKAGAFAGVHNDPHNTYLQAGVELGTVGLALLLFAIVSQFRTAKRAQASVDGATANLRIIACQAAACAMLAASFFLGILWFKAFWLVWIMLSLASSERAEEPGLYPVQSPAFESS